MSSLTQPCLPRACQLVIDDVGRREAIKARGPTYRRPPVIDRTMEPADYAQLADIGEGAGMRPQAAMELCDFDRENVCARYPTTQWEGANWDNSRLNGPWQEEVMRLFVERGDHLELTVHGVGHDYWIDGEPRPGEWADLETGKPWPDADDHAECFAAILRQYGMDKELPGGFPESFVACYFQYHLEDGDPRSTGATLARRGVRYASNPWNPRLKETVPKPDVGGAFDSGLLLIERDNMGCGHSEVARVPDRPPETSIIGMHWGNMLAHEIAGNAKVAERWVEYLKAVDRAPGLILARDTRLCWSQWVYRTWGRVATDGPETVIDLSGVPARAFDEGFAQEFVLQVPLAAGDHVSSFRSDAFEAIGYDTRPGEARLTLRPTSRTGGAVAWEFGPTPLTPAEA